MNDQNRILKLKATRMWKKSTGFIPKHLREQNAQKPTENPIHHLNFDINKLVDSTVNSRKQSEISDENFKDNQEDASKQETDEALWENNKEASKAVVNN